MQGVLIFLLCFFVVCWILVAGYHLGIAGIDGLANTAEGSSVMITAYTGSALSVVFAVVITAAVMTNKK